MERERKNSEDSDVSSSGSSVMQYDVNILDDKDEIALPESSVVLVKQTSFTGEEKDTVSSGGHVTVVNINAEGTTEQTSDSGRSSADTPEVGESKTGHFDPQQAMAATDEISFDQEEIQYVSPSQPAMATTDDQAADSFYDPDGSPKDEEEEEEEGFDLNDYRIAHLVKEELVDFQYGGGIKKLERKDKKKEEEKPSVMSLRQAYRRPYRTAEEPFQSVPLKDAVRGESTDSQPDIPTMETGTLYSMHTNEEVTEPEEDKEEFKPVEEITMETDKAWEAIENTKPSYTSSSVHTGILRTIETPGDSSISLETQSFTDNESTRSLSPSARLSLSYEEDQVSSPPHTPTYFPRDELEKSHIKTQSLMERKSSFESEQNKSNVMPVSPPREKPSTLRSERPLSYQEKNERRLSDETIEKNNNQSEKTISSSLMGPRPFGMYRAKSEPSVQQISVASDDVPNIELTPVAEDNKVRKEARRLSALVGPQGYVRQGYSKIGFMPRSEGENENVLEEKSISMMALSPNRQSADSSVDMNGHSPATSTPMREDNGEAQPKKSLQKQYEDLQKQFSNWQQQLMENQALLSKKKLSPRSTSPVSPISPSRAPSKFSFEASALPPPAPAPPSVNRQPIKKSWSVEPKATAAKPDAKYVRPKSNNPYTLGGGTSGRFSSSDLMSGKAQLRKGSSGYSTEFSSVDSGADIPPLPLSPPPSAPPVMQSTNKNIPREGSPTSLKRSLSSDPPPAPKPPPVQKVAAPSKSGAPRGKSRFEPKLDPREELMIAIRSAGGRQALNKVPVNKTKWYYTGPSRSALKS